MKKIKEILRLRYELKQSQQAIAAATGIARSTVRDYLLRAKAANILWPLPAEMNNEDLNELLFPQDAAKGKVNRPCPNWENIHTELKRKSVTLQILWEEYKRANPDGYQYSWFVYRYREWAKSKDVWMPQVHKAGEKAFVDYSGLKVPIHSTNMQEILYEAEIFVGVLGASDLIFCHATQSQALPDWVESHQCMFEYYQGVPEIIIPDNLRTGVNKPSRYEPVCNATYEELAQHYHCVVMPTRTYRPKDKAKVEKAVQLCQQRILAALRHDKFVSLEQLNIKITELLEKLNHRYSKAFGCSRWELFEKVERSELKALPSSRYELATWQRQKVNGGYHVSVEQHHYSVPYQYINKQVDIRVTSKTIEVFYQDERITCHRRDNTRCTYTTIEAHRPEAHRQQAMWQSTRLIAWAKSIGTHTHSLIQMLFDDPKRHLYQKEKSALGILRLSHAHSEVQLELACEKALSIGTYRYDSIESILKRCQLNVDSTDKNYQTPSHENVRGPQYYH